MKPVKCIKCGALPMLWIEHRGIKVNDEFYAKCQYCKTSTKAEKSEKDAIIAWDKMQKENTLEGRISTMKELTQKLFEFNPGIFIRQALTSYLPSPHCDIIISHSTKEVFFESFDSPSFFL